MLFTMPKLTTVEHERVIGMLQANVASSVKAQHFRCHVRTITNRVRQTGTASDRSRPGRPRVTALYSDISSAQSISSGDSGSYSQSENQQSVARDCETRTPLHTHT